MSISFSLLCLLTVLSSFSWSIHTVLHLQTGTLLDTQNISSFKIYESGRVSGSETQLDADKAICEPQSVDKFTLTLSTNGPPSTLRSTMSAIPCSCTPKVHEAMSRAVTETYRSAINYNLETTSPLPIQCCRDCVIVSDHVVIYYWPQNMNVTKSIDSHPNATLTEVPISSVVSDGFTFISPSVYVSYNNIKATASCAVTWGTKPEPHFRFGKSYNTIIAYKSEDLSTAACSSVRPVFAAKPHNGRFWFQPQAINFRNYSQDKAHHWECATAIAKIGNKADHISVNGPFFMLPEHLTNIDPLWDWCHPTYFPEKDPPQALLQEISITRGVGHHNPESEPKVTPAISNSDDGVNKEAARPLLIPPTPTPTESPDKSHIAPENGGLSGQNTNSPEVANSLSTIAITGGFSIQKQPLDSLSKDRAKSDPHSDARNSGSEHESLISIGGQDLGDEGEGSKDRVHVDGQAYSVGAYPSLSNGLSLLITSNYVLTSSSSILLSPNDEPLPAPAKSYLQQQEAHLRATLANGGPTTIAANSPAALSAMSFSLDRLDGKVPAVTILDHTIVPDNAGFAIGTQSIKPGASAITVFGTRVSLGRDGVLVLGSSRTTILPGTANAITLTQQATLGSFVLQDEPVRSASDSHGGQGNTITPQVYTGIAVSKVLASLPAQTTAISAGLLCGAWIALFST